MCRVIVLSTNGTLQTHHTHYVLVLFELTVEYISFNHCVCVCVCVYVYLLSVPKAQVNGRVNSQFMDLSEHVQGEGLLRITSRIKDIVGKVLSRYEFNERETVIQTLTHQSDIDNGFFLSLLFFPIRMCVLLLCVCVCVISLDGNSIPVSLLKILNRCVFFLLRVL